MTAWLKRAAARLAGRRPCTWRDALAECHAEAWDCAEELIALEQGGAPPSTAERDRVLAALTRIARCSAREMGWIG